jgi:hypothetical protein
MANKNRPNGLVPLGVPLRLNPYVAGGVIYPNDPVKKVSSGKVVKAAPGDALLGSAVGASTGDNQPILVADHPDQQFVIQADDAGVGAQTDIGNNADIVAGSDDVYKASRFQLDGSSLASDSNLPLRLLGIERQVGEGLGDKAKCKVRINAHQLAPNTEGV